MALPARIYAETAGPAGKALGPALRRRAVGYVRVSTDEQAEKGFSLGEQRDRIAAYCQQEGLELTGIVSDDISGQTLDRPGLDRVSEMAETGAFDVLVCVKLDRLARLNHLRRLYEDWLQEMGIEVLFTDQRFDPTPNGRLHKGITGQFDEYEVERIRERTMINRVRKAVEKEVMPVQGHVYGYHQISVSEANVIAEYRGRSGELVINEEEAIVVRRIFEMCASGMSTRGICKVLREEGIPARDGGLWVPPTMARALRNETYIGCRYYGKNECRTIKRNRGFGAITTEGAKEKRTIRARPKSEWIMIRCPAIVSEELFQTCQERLKENGERRRGRPSLRWPLQGCVFCGVCTRKTGAPLMATGYPNKTVRYHACTSRIALDRKRCGSKVRADRLEEMALDALRRAATPNRLAEMARQEAEEAQRRAGDPEQEAQRLQKELLDVETRESRLVDLALDAKINPQVLQQKSEELQRRRETLTTRLSEVRRLAIFTDPREAAEKADAAADRLREALPLAEKDPEKLQELFRLFVEITIYPDREPEITVKVPDRILNCRVLPEV